MDANCCTPVTGGIKIQAARQIRSRNQNVWFRYCERTSAYFIDSQPRRVRYISLVAFERIHRRTKRMNLTNGKQKSQHTLCTNLSEGRRFTEIHQARDVQCIEWVRQCCLSQGGGRLFAWLRCLLVLHTVWTTYQASKMNPFGYSSTTGQKRGLDSAFGAFYAGGDSQQVKRPRQR